MPWQSSLLQIAMRLGFGGNSSGRKGGGASSAHAALAGNAGNGRRFAGGLGGKGGVGAGGLNRGLNQLSLDQDGDDLACGQAEGAVVEHGENGANLARVAGDANPGVVVVRKDVVNRLLGTGDLVSRRLALVLFAAPQQVLLGEASLELKVGSVGVNLRLGGAAVAGVDADALAKQLLDDGFEGV